MTLPVYVVDAFTGELFRGNSAAVVALESERPASWMQQVAAEMKHPATAFVRGTGDDTFALQWFTPEVELDLCGHATLATSHVLWDTKRLHADACAVFSTRSGELRAAREGGRLRLDFPLPAVEPAPPVPALFDALGLAASEMFRAGDSYMLVEVGDPATVRALTPDFAALRALDTVRAVIVTAAGGEGDGHDCVSRVFGPRIGIDEDPVTGSAHCVLAAYWCARLATDELRAYQASARGGEMLVRRAGDRAYLLGTAVTVLQGEFNV